MLPLRKIAVTGSVASGKTLVCRYLQELGAFVLSADAVVHELLLKDVALCQRIVQKFGSDILQEGIIDRTLLAKKAFQNPEAVHWLEKEIHPKVFERIEAAYQLAASGFSSFIVEVPLLFEAGWESFFDLVVTVVANEDLCKARFVAAGHAAEDYAKRTKRQLPSKSKEERAHYTLHNNGTPEELKHQVKNLYHKIITEELS
ncbi:MAG: dephospho-CoA kinase [Verrucomicrobiota bacterium]|nr:dephospho-CoA kinase [Verrucomicrobiota bacterium]